MTKELKMNAIPMTEDAASTVQATNNLEYVNLMEYLPLRYPPTLEEEKNRRIVSNFKRGRCSPELKNQFTDAIKQLKEERKDVKLRVCFMPAITADKTALRYSQLATAIETETGIPSDYHTILPKPTSPHTSLSIGCGFSISSLTSCVVLSWSGVSSYIKEASSSCCI